MAMVLGGNFVVVVVPFSAMARFAVVLMRMVNADGEFGSEQESSARIK
jgi:hypothetical protein